jgi:glycosyltransferase involved in cell wall biosynthesis
MKTDLTVIIPIYKTEKTLNRCIESVLRNAVDEIILVDDGSPDNCPIICDNWGKKDSRISVIHKENGGLSDARNAGIKRVKTKYVTFVDSDDEIAPDTYMPLVTFLNQNPHTDIIEYPAQIHIGRKDERRLAFNDSINDIFSLEQKRQIWLNDLFAHSYACNKIYQTKLFHDISFKKGALFEDVLITPYLLKKANYYATSSKGLYLYHSNSTGITLNFTNLPQLLQAQLQICKDMGIDIMSREADRLYLSLVNTYIDICRHTNISTNIPYRRISFSSAQNAKERIKILMYNVLGQKFFIKIFVLLRHLMIVMVLANILY